MTSMQRPGWVAPGDPEIRVVVLPAAGPVDFQDDPDPGDVVFDEEGRPILEWTRHPSHRGEGWVLTYLDPDDPGSPEDHPIGGRLDDVDWALEQAREHLRWRWSAEGRP